MDLNARTAAVRQSMAAHGIDLLIAASNGLPTLDRPDAVVYLSRYRSLGESIFVLDREAGAMLIVSPAADAERGAAWPGCTAFVATDDLVGVLEAELSQRKLAAGRLATAGIDS